MKDTCEFEKCYFFGLLDDIKQCPNYMENGWIDKESGEYTVCKDCSPKRTLLMVQDLYNRMIGVQKSQEEQRNESNKIMRKVIPVVLNMMDGKTGDISRLSFSDGENIKEIEIIRETQ